MSEQYYSDFQIVGTSVKSLKLRNDFILLPNQRAVKRTLDISHAILSVEASDDGRFTGVVQLEIKVAFSHEKKKYKLDMAIEGCFTAPTEMGEDAFRDMLNINGITSLYSISRGFVQSVSAQTLLSGNVLLPMINVVAYSVNKNEPEEE